MATSGSGTTGAKQNRSLTFSWSRTSTNYTNNTSTISWTLKGSGSASEYVKGGGLYVKINGSVKVNESTDTRYNIYNGTSLKSGTATITHNANGSKTFNVEVKAGIYEYARNVSLNKNFTLDSLTRTVTYNANGGTGTTSSQTKTFGTALTLRSNSFTRTGYTFVKWNTKADGTGTSYNAGASFTSEVASTTLYAIWKANTYTVSYNANGGSGAPSNQTKTYGTALTLSSTKPSRTGYSFSGWNTKADGSGTAYAAGASYTANAAVTLYAQWTPLNYTLKIDANGGYRVSDNSTAVISVTKASGSTEHISERKRTGYTLTGYVITNTSSGSTTDIGGATLTFDSSTKTAEFKQGSVAVTLTAQWKINTYTVTFNGNGGTSSEASKTANYNTTISTLPTATKKNYKFIEWNTAADGTGTAFTNSTKVTGNITVYAIYELAANCFVKHNGTYVAAMLYVLVDGIYKTGTVSVKDNGTYKQSGM